MTIAEQLEFLKKGTIDLIREEDLKKKLERVAKTGKPLRVKLGLDPRKFNINTVPERVLRVGDLFRDISKEGFVLKSVQSALTTLLGE